MKTINYFLMLFTLLKSYNVYSQTTCASTINIFPSGSTTVNGVQVSYMSTGSVENGGFSTFLKICQSGGSLSSGSSLKVGGQGSWSLVINFDKPINDVKVVLSAVDSTTGAENFVFNSNGGPVSISSENYCGIAIGGNQLIANPVGGGIFKVHTIIPYTQLIISGQGGSDGSILGICSTSISVLGVKDVVNGQNSTIDIFPNPTKGITTISSQEKLKSYKVFTESGRLIHSAPLKGNKQEINLSSLETGSYMLSVETEKQKINKKIIKR
ncbi:T9SS C-terminal target domain-containing protein [Chryseobacterium nematophagum]|uniref:T9SS C-terminal target domain-containing protein n=1 Tax=Chryseobacterium nematophagum TaxID=2305228 RepID=A0A3M7THJ5_9FLAO|nr:T9SS type A sorting domain-containing protein [Chryseobacterium nematophagum]RNA62466.1 T9SS C-terminal target domain-containing protein [Chryseobacterium nematophagum]